ncbi:hypothetical protein [Shewanella sp. GXUN23E]|uniref:TackOD1 domain-containing metal-binding protein n=1 Tax=Shewanella sp. GXUN23E TaxID=3422498 RepID=UPI003D7E5F62
MSVPLQDASPMTFNHQNLQIGWFGEPDISIQHGGDIQMLCTDEYQDIRHDILVIGAHPHADELLMALRREPATALSLIFVTSASAMSAHLANGLWQQGWYQTAEMFLQRQQLWQLEPGDNLELRLLSYLWLHPGSTLEPLKTPATAQLYDYPLLTAWGIEQSGQIGWLNALTQKGWLESQQLVNRVRYSPCCHSSRLNYLDSCPACQDINIQLQTSLHCFNCGHIASEQSFRKQTGLSCPNCYQTLRHIGVDYDRPIENQQCLHCKTLFVDAAVSAQCLECNTSHELQDLIVSNVCRYGLTLAGQLLARQGVVANLFTDYGGNQMSLSQFCWLANWQNQLAKRHQHCHSILAVKLANDEQLCGGAMQLKELEILQQRICAIVRTTDACTQYTEAGMLFLLPFTQAHSVRTLVNKFIELKQSFSVPLYFDFRSVSLPADTGLNFQSWLLDSLASAKPLGHE